MSRRSVRKREQLELAIAEALDQFDRVDFGRWRWRVNDETIMSPLSTSEVARIVVKKIVESR